MKPFELTKKAKEDPSKIAKYTENHWGRDQRCLYIPLALKNSSFIARKFWWRTRRKDAVIASYCKALQRRYPPKDACYK